MTANKIMSQITQSGLSLLVCCKDGVFIAEAYSGEGRIMAEGNGENADAAIYAMHMDYVREVRVVA